MTDNMEKDQNVDSDEKMDQKKQEHYSEKQSVSPSPKTKLKKIFERRLDKHSGEVLFNCLYCQFQSRYLEDMICHINSIHEIGSEMVRYDRRSYQKMETEEKICGICLKTCDSFKVIEGGESYIKDALDIVLPKMDLAAIQGLLVCTHCTEILIKCSSFKTLCLSTYNYIVSFAGNKDKAKLNLREVFLSKNENGVAVAEDEVICGFCMDPIKNCSATSLDFEERDVILKIMIERCLPELNLSLIEKPVICAPCHGSLENCFHFVTNCSLVEEKNKKCSECEVNSNSVDIEQFYEERKNTVEGNIEIGRDIFKLGHEFSAESKCAVEENKELIEIQETFCGENEIYLKEENVFEVEDHKILVKEETEIKTDGHRFNRFDDGVLPQPKVTTTARRKRPKVTHHKLYKCNTCSHQTYHKANFKNHLQAHKNPSEVTMYKCNFCSFQTKYKDSLKIHLVKHKNPSQLTMYECDSCSFQTKLKHNLKIHLRIHNNPLKVKMYKCDSCSFETCQKHYLQKHVLVHKSSLEVYKCDSCPFQTKDMYYIKKHSMRHKSPSELTMYKCETCSYQAKHKQDFKTHLLVHEDPSNLYKCDSCSFQTRQKDNLKTHQLVHERSTEIPIYKCNSCPYEAKQKYSLKRHILKHMTSTVYNCNICSFHSIRKGLLKIHLLSHNNPPEATILHNNRLSYFNKKKQSTITGCQSNPNVNFKIESDST